MRFTACIDGTRACASVQARDKDHVPMQTTLWSAAAAATAGAAVLATGGVAGGPATDGAAGGGAAGGGAAGGGGASMLLRGDTQCVLAARQSADGYSANLYAG